MKIKFESDDDLTLGKILNILVCVILNIPVLELFFKKTTTIIHKFIYINVCMIHCFIHQLHEVSFIYCFCFSFCWKKSQYSNFSIHQLHKVSFIYCFYSYFFFRQNLNTPSFA